MQKKVTATITQSYFADQNNPSSFFEVTLSRVVQGLVAEIFCDIRIEGGKCSASFRGFQNPIGLFDIPPYTSQGVESARVAVLNALVELTETNGVPSGELVFSFDKGVVSFTSIGGELIEQILSDDYGDQHHNVNLTELVSFIEKNFAVSAEVIFEDNDDYGCDHYVRIKGMCADIIIRKNYGGAHNPTRYLTCKVDSHRYQDIQTRLSSEFSLKIPVDEVSIALDYMNEIRRYMCSHAKFLRADSALFSRVDYAWYDDGRGVHQVMDVAKPYSYTITYVSDSDFYSGQEIRSDIESCKKDEWEHLENEKKRERIIVNTEHGVVVIASPYDPEGEIWNNSRFWIATLVVNSCYAPYGTGSSEDEALRALMAILDDQ